MTKKDYILIAQTINDSFDIPFSDSETAFINKLADRLIKDNPLFNKTKFLTECVRWEGLKPKADICHTCGFSQIGVHHHESEA